MFLHEQVSFPANSCPALLQTSQLCPRHVSHHTRTKQRACAGMICTLISRLKCTRSLAGQLPPSRVADGHACSLSTLSSLDRETHRNLSFILLRIFSGVAGFGNGAQVLWEALPDRAAQRFHRKAGWQGWAELSWLLSHLTQQNLCLLHLLNILRKSGVACVVTPEQAPVGWSL